MSDVRHSAVTTPLVPEDQARADFYALLARLYAAPPDRALLDAIAHAPPLAVPTFIDETGESGRRLYDAWDKLRSASSVMEPDAAEQEYVDLFIGVGKSEVNLHGSHWLTGFMMEKPLVEVRATLTRLGLARRSGVTVAEDHLSALLETMRALVAGMEDRPPSRMEDQEHFLSQHITPWVTRCCAAINAHPVANYYRRVAEFTDCFVALERDSFAMA